jgi:nucleotide-binding universal stress UspA family protein
MKILFATDGSISAFEAERLIDKVADRDRATVTVVSVVPTGVPSVQDIPLVIDPLPERRKDGLGLVDAAVERFLAAGFKAEGRLLEGHPADQIIDLVARDWHEVTVVGAGSTSWLGQLLLGSVSSHVLHSAPNSVVVVHRSIPDTDTARVLFATDGSRGSTMALNDYMDLADPIRCDTVVMAVERYPLENLVPTFPIPPMVDPATEKKILQAAQDRAERLTESAVTRLQDHHFTATAKPVLGHPITSLLEEADSGRYDLVVAGSRGHGPVSRVLIGSVSDKLARHARAVLVGRHLKG